MRAFSLLKLLLLLFIFSLTLVACEPQTYFRLSLRSLRKITPAYPTGKSISVNVIFRRERSDDRKYVCGSQAMTFFPSGKSMQTNKQTNKEEQQTKQNFCLEAFKGLFQPQKSWKKFSFLSNSWYIEIANFWLTIYCVTQYRFPWYPAILIR